MQLLYNTKYAIIINENMKNYDYNIIKKLLPYFNNLTYCNDNNKNLLTYAVECNNSKLIEFLLETKLFDESLNKLNIINYCIKSNINTEILKLFLKKKNIIITKQHIIDAKDYYKQRTKAFIREWNTDITEWSCYKNYKVLCRHQRVISKLYKEHICTICFNVFNTKDNKIKECYFIPCGHSCCVDCSYELDECCICREKIVSIIIPE